MTGAIYSMKAHCGLVLYKRHSSACSQKLRNQRTRWSRRWAAANRAACLIWHPAPRVCRSGFPFTVTSGVDNSLSGVGLDRADFLGGQPRFDPDRPHGQLVANYFNTALFARNAVGTFGNEGKGILRGPGLFD